jgi:hypothetical protein
MAGATRASSTPCSPRTTTATRASTVASAYPSRWEEDQRSQDEHLTPLKRLTARWTYAMKGSQRAADHGHRDRAERPTRPGDPGAHPRDQHRHERTGRLQDRGSACDRRARLPRRRDHLPRQVPALVRAGYRVVVPTLRGYAPSGVAWSGRHDALAADLVALADATPPAPPRSSTTGSGATGLPATGPPRHAERRRPRVHLHLDPEVGWDHIDQRIDATIGK